MRLKKVKLAGFKSFVEPTSIPFPTDMTAIIGPNGCGKSNVIDAVRWVLGESSAKNLRGDAMTDVIFNGSTNRQPVSQCSVELVFDNSSGRVAGNYAAFSDISVKRIVTRDAQSVYLLNNARCRRKDVTDLFLGTGLGPRSYAIIEQGMISKLIESRPQELRVFIEEAAGISRYKERRKDTENRMRHALDNLERLDDVRAELDEQLKKLKRQATAAIKYKELKEKERQLRAQLHGQRLQQQQDTLERCRLQLHELKEKTQELSTARAVHEAQLAGYEQSRVNINTELEQLQQQLFSTNTQIAKLEQAQQFARERRAEVESELSELSDKAAEIQEKVSSYDAELAVLNEEYHELIPVQQELQESIDQLRGVIDERRLQLSSSDTELKQCEQICYERQRSLDKAFFQLESTQSQQERNKQLSEELAAERAELSEDCSIIQRLHDIDEAIAELKMSIDTVKDEQARLLAEQEEIAGRLETKRSQLNQAKNSQLRVQANLDALKSVQLAEKATGLDKDAPDSWAQLRDFVDELKVEPGYEGLFELVMQPYQLAKLVTPTETADAVDFLEMERFSLLEQAKMTTIKPKGTLAYCCKNPRVPSFLTHIKLLEDCDDVMAARSGLTSFESVVCRNGIWAGRDWIIKGRARTAASLIARAAEIQHLERQLDEQSERVDEALGDETSVQQEFEESTDRWERVDSKLSELELQQAELTKEQHDLIAARNNQLQRLRDIETRIERVVTQSSELEQQVKALSHQIASAQQSFDETKTRLMALNENRAEYVAMREREEAELSQRQQKLHQMDMKIQNISNQRSLLAQHIQAQQDAQLMLREREEKLRIEAQKLADPTQYQGDDLQMLLQHQQQLIGKKDELNQQLFIVENDINASKHEIEVQQTKLSELSQQHDRVMLEQETSKVTLQHCITQLKDLDIDFSQVIIEPDIDVLEIEQEIEKTQSLVTRLGAVNLTAVKEFETQSERKNHLDQQHQDLSQALETLQTAIRKIDRETKARFKETFTRINDDLGSLFPKVFGGGEAYLELTDDDMLNTGVTIMARPPGKKNSSIQLLSGGEKALTALSLVFAIFRLNPAPFCMLDEVDAPLDDANVRRFCTLVSEMSQTVQFIYITHNKISMEMASQLSGVTMSEPGVSRLVAVDVEKALEMVE